MDSYLIMLIMLLLSIKEACAVGIEAVVNGNDSVITAYRCHGWAFTRGIPIKAIMAEMMGKHIYQEYMHIHTGHQPSLFKRDSPY